MDNNKLFDEAADSWRNNRGIGSMLIPPPLNAKIIVYNILTKVYCKRPKTFTVIIVEELTDRVDIIEFLTNQDSEENNKDFKELLDNKLIRVFTKDFVRKGCWKSPADLCICYQPIDYSLEVGLYVNSARFRLIVLNKLLDNNKIKCKLFENNPLLPCFEQIKINELRTSSPVEEMYVDVAITKDSKEENLYNYYCEYINTTLNIFGSFDNIKYAALGNAKLNISSASICESIARENGWSDHLDMSCAFNMKIDDLYNPNALRERATKIYEIIRNRNNLVSDYEGKLEAIFNIVKDNKDKKILIINKNGEFASKVTDYLNKYSDKDICGNYHNKVEDIPAVNEYGSPMYYKSGKEKGKRKAMGYRAQMTLNEKRFNLNIINCLSMSNSPDKDLSVDFDIIIITSPLCEDIKSYLYRLSKIRLNSNQIQLYSLYCKNTIEEQRLLNKEVSDNHIIVNKEKISAENENNCAFIIAD